MNGGRRGPVNPDNFVTLRAFLNPGETLDIGSGDAHPHADVTLDSDPRVKPDVVHDLNDGIPFDDNEFANVTAVHVIEHLEDDVGLWEEMKRVASKASVAVVPIGHRDDPDHEHEYGSKEEVVSRFDPDVYDTSRMGPMWDLVFADLIVGSDSPGADDRRTVEVVG